MQLQQEGSDLLLRETSFCIELFFMFFLDGKTYAIPVNHSNSVDTIFIVDPVNDGFPQPDLGL
jgi:hypothetical protein